VIRSHHLEADWRAFFPRQHEQMEVHVFYQGRRHPESDRRREMRSLQRLVCTLPFLAFYSSSLSCDRAPAGKVADVPEGHVEWVDPKLIQPGPIRRDTLSEEQMARIRTLQTTFVEVDGQTVEQWVDNFKRDADPDKELRVWERMSKAYQAYCVGRTLSADAKQDVYRVVLLRSMASEQDVIERVKLKELSRQDAIAVMKGY